MQGIEPPPVNNATQNSSGANFLKRAFESRSNKANVHVNSYRWLGSPDVYKVMLVCSLYHTALNTLTQMKLDILTGI